MAVCGVSAVDGVVAKAVLLCDVGAASFPLIEGVGEGRDVEGKTSLAGDAEVGRVAN